MGSLPDAEAVAAKHRGNLGGIVVAQNICAGERLEGDSRKDFGIGFASQVGFESGPWFENDSG